MLPCLYGASLFKISITKDRCYMPDFTRNPAHAPNYFLHHGKYCTTPEISFQQISEELPAFTVYPPGTEKEK